MKKQRYNGQKILMLIAGLCFLTAARMQATPNGIWVRELNFSAGTIKPGARVDRAFRVVNLSFHPILVSTLSTCGCTTADLTESSLLPLHSMIIQAHVDTKHEKIGPHQKNMALVFRSGQKSWEQETNIKYAVQ